MNKRGKIIAAVIAVLMTASVLTGCNAKKESIYTTSDNYVNYVVDANVIQDVEDSVLGRTTVYYTNGIWVTMRDGKLYTIQQYLVPNNVRGTLLNEVSEIPFFNGEDVTFKGYNAETGDILDLPSTTTFSEVCKSYNSNNIVVYTEWQGTDGNYYSYVLQYGSVAILYMYTVKENLFREYVALVQDYSNSFPAETTQSTETVQSTESAPSETEVSETTTTAPAESETGDTSEKSETVETTGTEAGVTGKSEGTEETETSKAN